MKPYLFILLCFGIGLVFFLEFSQAPAAAQAPEPSQTPTPQATKFPPVPDDIIPFIRLVEQDQTELAVTASDYKVIPIWFVPNDLAPNALALPYLDNHMQLIQRWYGEQMRDKTFSLEPARIVIGSQSLSYYYGPCFPPSAEPTCNWVYDLFFNIFDDLSTLGYPYQSNHIIGVFFQHNGLGSSGLGGGNRFLIDLNRNNTFGDCLYPGCGVRVNDQGGAAHELGHGFGLPHTSPDSEHSDSVSVMFFGFYSFPRANLANTTINPERNMLNASPFFNLPLTLKNGGFEHEDCLFAWNVLAGAATCATGIQRSGLSGLQLLPNGSQPDQVSQKVEASAGQTYDLSGWINIPASAAQTNVQLQVQALSAVETVLATYEAGDYTTTTADWQRFGFSITMPPNTAKARIQVNASGSGTIVYLDDFDFHLAQAAPPAPSPLFYSDGDAVPTLQPVLRWSEVPAATFFQVQVAADKDFTKLISDAVVSSLFYTVPEGLTYDRPYFWRVRAGNGAGQSDWSVTWSFVPRTAADYYNEEFETTSLSSGWSWLREDSGGWGFGGPLNRRGYGYLGIIAQRGELFEQFNNAKNLLLRATPPGDFEVSTAVEFYEPLNTNYQQGGLFIYQDDDNYIKLARLYLNNFRLQIQAEVNGTVVQQTAVPINNPVPIKITRLGNSYTGYYSPDGITWQQVGQPVAVDWANPKMGLGAYRRNAITATTAYFEYFRVTTPITPTSVTGNYETFLPLIMK
jgi:regulation of enolase protein 1 (concanavalin A-like superfamily)